MKEARLYIICAGVAFFSLAAWPKGILYSNSIPQIQIERLNDDLTRVTGFVDDTGDLKEILGVKDLSQTNLLYWLTDRVSYLIGETEDVDGRTSELKPYDYQNPGILPDFEIPKESSKKPITINPTGSRVGVAMTNVGTNMYYHGKEKKVLVSYAFEGEGQRIALEVKSPRIGILQMGEALFSKKINESNDRALANSIFRLSILFHEAHHTDGNAKSCGFPHAVCPKGSDYYNTNACDRALNGPYHLQALFIRQALLACELERTCSDDDIEKLAFIGVDLESRVLSDVVWDAKPEGL